jgi:hypothetical protein
MKTLLFCLAFASILSPSAQPVQTQNFRLQEPKISRLAPSSSSDNLLTMITGGPNSLPEMSYSNSYYSFSGIFNVYKIPFTAGSSLLMVDSFVSFTPQSGQRLDVCDLTVQAFRFSSTIQPGLTYLGGTPHFLTASPLNSNATIIITDSRSLSLSSEWTTNASVNYSSNGDYGFSLTRATTTSLTYTATHSTSYQTEDPRLAANIVASTSNRTSGFHWNKDYSQTITGGLTFQTFYLFEVDNDVLGLYGNGFGFAVKQACGTDDDTWWFPKYHYTDAGPEEFYSKTFSRN